MINRILIIDDEKDIVELINDLIEIEFDDIETDCTSNVGDGIDLISSNEYMLICTDYNMPGKNGFELVQAVRKSTSMNTDTPFLVITGEGDEVTNQFSDLEKVEVLNKSTELSRLTDLINKLLA